MGANLIASVLSLDFKNAFNSVSRAHIAREVAKVLPCLSRFFHLAYSRPAKLFIRRRGAPPAVFFSRAGVRQGNPLGSLYFAIAITPLLRALAARFPALEVDAYCDDVSITAPDEALPKDEVIAFAEAEGAPYGLNLQPPKCTLWRASSGEAVTILGAPLGQAVLVRAALRAKVEGEHAKLVALQNTPHQVALLLLRFCHAPRLNHLARVVPLLLLFPFSTHGMRLSLSPCPPCRPTRSLAAPGRPGAPAARQGRAGVAAPGWGCRTWLGWPKPPSPPALLLPSPLSLKPIAPSLSVHHLRTSLVPPFMRWSCLRTEVCRAPPPS